MTLALNATRVADFASTKEMVSGSTRTLLRLESIVALALSTFAYRHLGGSWPLFAVLFLVPDVTMAGYWINPALGARFYNAGHTYVAPALLALCGLVLGQPVLYLLAALWSAHIGWDRLAGYGLKHPSSFQATHLSA